MNTGKILILILSCLAIGVTLLSCIMAAHPYAWDNNYDTISNKIDVIFLFALAGTLCGVGSGFLTLLRIRRTSFNHNIGFVVLVITALVISLARLVYVFPYYLD